MLATSATHAPTPFEQIASDENQGFLAWRLSLHRFWHKADLPVSKVCF
jgi:hypothetical protein